VFSAASAVKKNPQSTIGNRQLTPCVIRVLFPRLPAGFAHCPVNVCVRSLALEALLFGLRLQFTLQCLWHFVLNFLLLFAANQIDNRQPVLSKRSASKDRQLFNPYPQIRNLQSEIRNPSPLPFPFYLLKPRLISYAVKVAVLHRMVSCPCKL